ncbi:amino acid ABC transporter permease [Vibrio sp. CK2-1]|uniref:amino acid ABC transporter permease n=1 Tax=Vibrio sp. CK2-1 TaxID=2912249 RepID=UPI001F22F258|nr:amino acid ABC transporter permease [Vibrio sp. CK2-1]MCF7352764.1 amino acid ABC transporter permease [Vibrio sp. CK2-1]
MDSYAWIQLGQGAWVTVWISFVSIVLGISIGLVIAIVRMMKLPWIDQFLGIYVSWARATPLVTLVLFIFLTFPSFGLQLDKNLSAILALTLNTAAFNAEIWRNAFLNFSKGQLEAAEALGMRRVTYFCRIMFPQMLLVSLPALINEMSFLIKGSPAIAVIGVVDLTRVTNRISAVTYEPLSPILCAAVIYMVIIGALVKLQSYAELKTQYLR